MGRSTKVEKAGAEAPKKRVMTSYEKLNNELLEKLKARYPDGFTDHMTRVEKPNGELCYGVMLETDDTSYFVRISVKIDNKTKEEIEKELLPDNTVIEGEEIKGAEEFTNLSDGDES